jgi:hypothetical protein
MVTRRTPDTVVERFSAAVADFAARPLPDSVLRALLLLARPGVFIGASPSPRNFR